MEGLDLEKVSEDDFSLSSESERDAEALWVHFIIVALQSEGLTLTQHTHTLTPSHPHTLTSITVLKSLM